MSSSPFSFVTGKLWQVFRRFFLKVAFLVSSSEFVFKLASYCKLSFKQASYDKLWQVFKYKLTPTYIYIYRERERERERER